MRLHFPSWRYHRTEPARIIHSPEEDARLGHEWAGTPAVFTDDAEEPQSANAASAPESEPTPDADNLEPEPAASPAPEAEPEKPANKSRRRSALVDLR